MPGGQRTRYWAPFLVVTTVFAALVGLEFAWPRAAQAVLTSWGMEPFRFPFLDTDTVLSALRCRRLGVDPISSNPCDALERMFDYSPLWLAASALPVTTNWIVPAGFAVDGAFLLSLLLLPAARVDGQALVVILAVLSTPVVFAMERGNNDLVIFVLAVLMATLAARRELPWRLIGYGCGLLAGLLKFYPMMLLAMACRERPRVFVAVTAVCVAVVSASVAWALPDLRRVLQLIPAGKYTGDMFGATTLPFGIVSAFDLPPLAAGLGLLCLMLIALGAGVAFGVQPSLGSDLRRLSERERLFLLAGGLPILACFFTSQNIGYRALLLLPILPGMTALAGSGRRRALYGFSVAVVLVVLWSPFWRHALEALLQLQPPWQLLSPSDGIVSTLAWMLRELCWWWVVTMLIGLCVGVLLRSPVARLLLPALSEAAMSGGGTSIRPRGATSGRRGAAGEPRRGEWWRPGRATTARGRR